MHIYLIFVLIGTLRAFFYYNCLTLTHKCERKKMLIFLGELYFWLGFTFVSLLIIIIILFNFSLFCEIHLFFSNESENHIYLFFLLMCLNVTTNSNNKNNNNLCLARFLNIFLFFKLWKKKLNIIFHFFWKFSRLYFLKIKIKFKE